MSSNSQLQLAHDFVEHTSTNIFLTGKAGTGKTTFLKNIRKVSSKRLIVVAPTGVAAINAQGETMHSFFQLPFSPHIPGVKNNQIRRFNKTKIAIIRTLDLLIIDEISMVRADMLDAVDEVLRRFRDRTKPFGGVQLLMIGDLQQLSPVVHNDEWDMLRNHYNTPYFFDSQALKSTSYVSIELTHIFRQRDRNFIDLLEKVRTASLDQGAIDMLNSRYIENFQAPKNKNFITLTSHNYSAKEINTKRLDAIKETQYTFKAEVRDKFPESQYPVDYELKLKLGAQVMFTKNDSSPEKRYVNGTIGMVLRIDDSTIEVKPNDAQQSIIVEKTQWDNCSYTLDETSGEIIETIEGSFIQYPLMSAWAITIHKSQGLTFDNTLIDARDAFSHGQVYVALSRCRTLEGIVLLSKLSYSAVISDYKIRSYMNELESNPVTQTQLEMQKKEYFRASLCDVYDYSFIAMLLGQLQRLVREKIAGSYPKLALRWQENSPAISNQIVGVGEKFGSQINFLLHNNDIQNTELRERITKASVYFTDKLSTLLCPLLAATKVKIEAKEVKKQLERLLDELGEQTRIKLELMSIPAKDFSTETYLKSKAKAIIEVQKTRGFKDAVTTKKEPKLDIEQSDIENDELFEHLKTWRLNKARKQAMPAYCIATQKALIGIANYMPRGKKEFLNIKGVGKTFVEKHADEVIRVIEDYLSGRI